MANGKGSKQRVKWSKSFQDNFNTAIGDITNPYHLSF